MQLNLKGFAQLVQDMAAALQGSATNLLDVSVGSVLRAIFEANASMALWLQWLILQVLQMTRASTSTGPDLDSWMADFNLIRLQATAATGQVTFSRYADGIPASIPTGTVVKTADGSVKFTVVADATSSIWQGSTSSYVVPNGVGSATLPVQCATPGSLGNVMVNSITTIASSLPGIDQVSNSIAFTNGLDAESDPAFRSRFQNYLGSLTRATLQAVTNAVAGLQQNLSVVVQENIAADGSMSAGTFLVIVDDGSGYPSSALLSSVAQAVDPIRPIATTFAVIAPQVQTVTAQVSVTLTNQNATSQYTAAIQQAIATYLNSLPIGASASATKVAMQIYSVSPTITNVSWLSLNGQAADISVAANCVIKSGSISVLTNAG